MELHTIQLQIGMNTAVAAHLCSPKMLTGPPPDGDL